MQKNNNRKMNTIASYATISSELSIKDFYCVFVRTDMILIAFSGPRNCVNTQYTALSGAMVWYVFSRNQAVSVFIRFKSEDA